MRDFLFRVEIPGPPIGKQRPRGSFRNGRMRFYTPKKTADWESNAANLMRQSYKGDQLSCPLSLVLVAIGKRPQRLMAKKHPDGRIWCTSSPDLDNIIKATSDALVLSGVVDDDKYIAHLVGYHFYAARDEDPCVVMELWRL